MTPTPASILAYNADGEIMIVPSIIPPLSIVRLKSSAGAPDWASDIGRRFRVGYYRPSDGLECIWLVNDAGKYEQTVDRHAIVKYFEIERLGKTKDYFGVNRPPIAAIGTAKKRTVNRRAATARPPVTSRQSKMTALNPPA
jgi:hypothetical protein